MKLYNSDICSLMQQFRYNPEKTIFLPNISGGLAALRSKSVCICVFFRFSRTGTKLVLDSPLEHIAIQTGLRHSVCRHNPEHHPKFGHFQGLSKLETNFSPTDFRQTKLKF